MITFREWFIMTSIHLISDSYSITRSGTDGRIFGSVFENLILPFYPDRNAETQLDEWMQKTG